MCLSVLAVLTAGAWPLFAADITRLGQPAELSIRAAGEQSVRITLQPIAPGAPTTPAQPLPNPTLVDRKWAEPALSLRALTDPVSKHVGSLDVKVTPDPLTVTVSDAKGQIIQSLNFGEASGNVSFPVGDAPILGMGEGGPTFDRRGRLDTMRPAWGSGTLGSRNPVALLIGTTGWGIYVAAPWVRVDLRAPDRGIFIPDDPNAAAPGAFDAFVFDAHDPAALMKDVSVLTGPAVLPPKWTLGYMQSHRTLETDQQMVALVDTFREKKLPIDAVIYLGTGFAPVGWNTPQPSLAFNPRVFTRPPQEVLADLHKDHVQVILHVVPPEARTMPSLQGNIPARDGETLDASHIQNYWQQHVATFNTGVDAWWPDEGDRFNLPERLERQKMYYQGPLSVRPDVRPWSLNRNGHLGSAQWGAWIWSGDTQSQWATLRDQVIVGLNESLSLSPYWGSDTGGFYPIRDFRCYL
jgi:alpha-glucosidase/alpha-D-xyloside xylohydrolase